MDENNREKDLEERVRLLEGKVDDLEYKMSLMRKKKPSQSNQIVENKEIYPQNIPQQHSKPRSKVKQKESKIGEAVIGKYIIGVLASILIFISAISLIGLIWGSLTSGMKLGLILGSGGLLTALGFILIKKYRNPITSIVLGTGAGLLFIGVLSAHIFFDMIGSSLAILLVGVWSIFFILSYKYTQMFLTTIIAYIGSFISLLFGLTLVLGVQEYVVLTMFVAGISLVLLITSNKWLSENKQRISILLSLLSFVTLLIGGLNVGSLVYGYIKNILFVLLFIILIVQNYLFKMADRKSNILWLLPINFVITLITVFTLGKYFEYVLDKTVFTFILINIIQLIIIELRRNEIREVNVIYYAAAQIIPIIILQYELFQIGLGLFIIYLVLILLQKFRNHNDYNLFISGLITFDALLLILNCEGVMGLWNSDVSVTMPIIYGLIQVATISYLLYSNYRDENRQNLLLKSVGLITYAINSFYISYMITYKFMPKVVYPVEGYDSLDWMVIQNVYTHRVVAFFILCILLCVVKMSGYMKDWFDEDFKWFNKYDNVIQDGTNIVFYIISTITLLIGLNILEIMNLEIFSEVLIILLGLISVALIQSSNLIKYSNNNNLTGVWIGLKYLILTWAVLSRLGDLNYESVILSVSGLVVAISSIIVGFKFKLKSLRLYGLILTILMVLKFVLIDLSQENSITRVVALLIGGLICFGITVIYNKLNKE